MPTLKVEKTPNIYEFKVFIDQNELIFDVQGKCSIEKENGEYAISWVIISQPNIVYSVKITEPASAVFNYSAKLDYTGKGINYEWIRIS